ncbi:MAG: hypothetical protein J2P25_21420 [Nocardiopsaceae bacterium]|nr:hypothetical protein [Nocardiopsaceae bacterium]
MNSRWWACASSAPSLSYLAGFRCCAGGVSVQSSSSYSTALVPGGSFAPATARASRL